jgi:hypothetical protein
MLKSKLIALSFIGVFCSVGFNGAFASSDVVKPNTDDNIPLTALDACKDRKENDNCMYIKNDTKFTGACQKKEDKLTCIPN